MKMNEGITHFKNDAFQEFEMHESNVRSYCRSFPEKFSTASGSFMYAESGKQYIDFFSGAGALNFGHNHPKLKSALEKYISSDGISHSLDFYTSAKEEFIKKFVSEILKKRNLSYKLQFTGPTGTNAVEAAMKLARKVTKRTNIVAFTNSFHGMSMGALAATANPAKRKGAGVTLGNVTFLPYDGYVPHALQYAEAMLRTGSGVDQPAAILVETVQGEGGLNTATDQWLRGIATLAKNVGALLIVDDIQSGCGRCGTFFSHEASAIEPDIICLSKSLSGYGLPLSMNLIKPHIDVWEPGEHNGTFRGNNLAFITAAAAIDEFWSTPEFESSLSEKSDLIQHGLIKIQEMAHEHGIRARCLGRGLMQGIDLEREALATAVSHHAFNMGLIVETCGVNSQVVKLLPALTTSVESLEVGINMLHTAIEKSILEKN
jgi:diaminobutyrate-2-oxoglutarate transaminase